MIVHEKIDINIETLNLYMREMLVSRFDPNNCKVLEVPILDYKW